MFTMNVTDNLRLDKECYKLRKKIFVDKFKYLETDEDMLCDQYDMLSNSYNIACYSDDDIIGSVRLSVDQGKGPIPTEPYFDFSSYVETDNLLAGSMLCCKNNYQIADWLCLMGYLIGAVHKVDYIVACVNPMAENLFRKLGFKRISAPFRKDTFPQPVLPMFITIEDVEKYLGYLIVLSNDSFFDKKIAVFEKDEIIKLESEGKLPIDHFISVILELKFHERRLNKSSNAAEFEGRKKEIYKKGDIIRKQFYVKQY